MDLNTFLIFVLVCTGVVFQAGHNLWQRHILKEGGLSVKVALIAQNLGATIILFVLCLILWSRHGYEYFTPNNTLWFFGAVGATTVTSVYIQWANAKARSLADTSLTAPISALTPGLVTITALLLGEVPSVYGWVGIILVALGTYWFGLGERARTSRDILRPFILFFLPSNFYSLASNEQSRIKKETTALRLSYGVALFGTIGLISDALVVRNGSMIFGFLLYSAFLFVFFVIANRGKVANIKNKDAVQLGVLSFFWTMHILVVFSMFAYAHIAYVGTLKRLSIVLVAVGAYFLLREEKALKRLPPIIVITFGAILLGFDGSMTKVIETFAP